MKKIGWRGARVARGVWFRLAHWSHPIESIRLTGNSLPAPRPSPLLFLILTLAAAITACAQAAVATPEPTTITIAGSTAMQPVLLDLTTAFNQQHPNILFNLRGGGSTVGEEHVQAGQIDLAASTILPTPPTTTTVTTPTPALMRIPVGLDGLAIIVHPSNLITTVSVLQLRDLYAGRLFDWSALQSTAGEVLLVSREDGSGSRLLFDQRIMGEDQVSLTAVIMPTSRDVVEFVTHTPQAIGYVSRAYVHTWIAPEPVIVTNLPQTPVPLARPEPTVRVLQLEGITPTLEQVRTQQYYLTQPIYLVSQGEPQGWPRQFIEFVLSPAGQEIVGRYHVRVR